MHHDVHLIRLCACVSACPCARAGERTLRLTAIRRGKSRVFFFFEIGYRCSFSLFSLSPHAHFQNETKKKREDRSFDRCLPQSLSFFFAQSRMPAFRSRSWTCRITSLYPCLSRVEDFGRLEPAPGVGVGVRILGGKGKRAVTQGGVQIGALIPRHA